MIDFLARLLREVVGDLIKTISKFLLRLLERLGVHRKRDSRNSSPRERSFVNMLP